MNPSVLIVELQCYVLEDGTRVLSQATFLEAMGRHPKASVRQEPGEEQVAPILQGKGIKPFITKDLAEKSSPIKFRTPQGALASGYRAELLPEACEVYLKARDAGVVMSHQKHIAVKVEILVRSFAKVGIIALIDEATGFQYDRSRLALESILEAFIKDELGKWAKRFPDEFYDELFRLKNLQWPSSKNPPQYVGHWTNDLVYKRLAPGVLDDLRQKTPKTAWGHRKHQFHRWLTDDIGHPRLQEHISSVIALMRSSDDWDDFHKRLNRALPIFKPMPLLEWADKKNAALEQKD